MMAGWVYFSSGYRPYRVFERFEWPRWGRSGSSWPWGRRSAWDCSWNARCSPRGVLLGRFGDTVVAAHQAALNVASVTCHDSAGALDRGVDPRGQGGRRDPEAVRRAGFSGDRPGRAHHAGLQRSRRPRRRGPIARLYSSDPDVLALMSRLLLYAAVFQLFDGFQVASNASAAGTQGHFSVPALITVVVYWVVECRWPTGRRSCEGSRRTVSGPGR